MNISTGLKLIKKWEGCKLYTYDDYDDSRLHKGDVPKGTPTIGWGMIESDYPQSGIHVWVNKTPYTITQKQADDSFKKLIKAKYVPLVDKWHKKYKWNVNQYNAMLSFVYNIGSLDGLTAKGTRTNTQIAKKILEYNKAGGRVLAGLTNRRKDEKKLFNTPVDKKSDKKSSSSKTTKIKRAYSGKLHNPSTSFKRGYAKKGDTGAYIGEYQGFLKWYYDIKTKNFVDSDFGSNTEKYVKKFQKDMKIKVDGLIGKSTYNKMKSVKK